MNGYKISLHKQVIKFLRELSRNDKELADSFLEAIRDIKKDPYNSKKLKGKFKDYNRIKKGNYRIIFEIDKKDKIILVVEVGKRSNIYK